MSILDALKKLVVKRGGTPKGSNIAEVIDDLAETSSGGGGGNNYYDVTINFVIEEDILKGTLSKNYTEIATAYEEGKTIRLIFKNEYGISFILPLCGMGFGEGSYVVYVLIGVNVVGVERTDMYAFLSDTATGTLRFIAD